MKAYLIGAVLTVGVAAVLSLLTPEGRGRRTYHLLLSISVLLVLTAPLAVREGCDDATALPNGEASNAETPEGGQVLLEATALALRDELASHFSFPPSEVGVTVGGHIGEGGAVTIRRVTVVLRGESRVRRSDVKAYLEDNIRDCEVWVNVE